MIYSLLIAASLVAGSSAVGLKYLSATTHGIDHPTLPTMWISETWDPPMGDGMESYNFVDPPRDDNPSSMWSNYTNPDCKRLIHVSQYDQMRYLLKCDAVNCCKEDMGRANQIEFQIPNVHPAWLSLNFSHTPDQTIINQYGDRVEGLDLWHWQFIGEHWDVYTKKCADCVNEVRLHRWEVGVGPQKVAIDFRNYTGIPESERTAFSNTFQIPDQCTGNILRCDDARAQGLLRERQYSTAEKLALWLEEARKLVK